MAALTKTRRIEEIGREAVAPEQRVVRVGAERELPTDRAARRYSSWRRI